MSFGFSFDALARQLDRRLARLERGQGVLVARYVFGSPPSLGREQVTVIEHQGMLFSDADFGCAWQGGTVAQPLRRSDIRDAFEFGVNIATYRHGTMVGQS